MKPGSIFPWRDCKFLEPYAPDNLEFLQDFSPDLNLFDTAAPSDPSLASSSASRANLKNLLYREPFVFH